MHGTCPLAHLSPRSPGPRSPVPRSRGNDIESFCPRSGQWVVADCSSWQPLCGNGKILRQRRFGYPHRSKSRGMFSDDRSLSAIPSYPAQCRPPPPLTAARARSMLSKVTASEAVRLRSSRRPQGMSFATHQPPPATADFLIRLVDAAQILVDAVALPGPLPLQGVFLWLHQRPSAALAAPTSAPRFGRHCVSGTPLPP